MSTIISTLPKLDLVRDFAACMDAEMRAKVLGDRAAALQGELDFDDVAGLRKALASVRATLQTPDDFAAAARAIAEDLFLRSIVHAEFHIDLLASEAPIEASIEAMEEGFEAISEDYPDAFLSWGLIVEIPRDGDTAAYRAALTEAIEAGGKRILAIALVGPETRLNEEQLALVAYARDNGLRLVVSAGLEPGGAALKDAVALSADRVLHGLNLLKKQDALAHVRAHRTPVVVTATIEVKTGRARSYQRHPLPKLKDAGVLGTFASGAAGLWDGCLTDEFEHLSVNLGWRLDALRNATLRAIEAAFIDPKLRFTVARAVENWRHRPRLTAGEEDGGFGM